MSIYLMLTTLTDEGRKAVDVLAYLDAGARLDVTPAPLHPREISLTDHLQTVGLMLFGIGVLGLVAHPGGLGVEKNPHTLAPPFYQAAAPARRSYLGKTALAKYALAGV